MSKSAWGEEAGEMEVRIGQLLSHPKYAFARGPLALYLRVSLYNRVREMFADERCDGNTRMLVREYLTGRKTT